MGSRICPTLFNSNIGRLVWSLNINTEVEMIKELIEKIKDDLGELLGLLSIEELVSNRELLKQYLKLNDSLIFALQEGA